MADSVKFTCEGTIMYPKNENGVQKYAVVVDDKTAKVFHALVWDKFSSDYKFSEIGNSLVINVKSRYTIPVYDMASQSPLYADESETSYIKVYHGAKGLVSMEVKPVQNPVTKKTTLSVYCRGIALEQNGEQPKGNDFHSLFGGK